MNAQGVIWDTHPDGRFVVAVEGGLSPESTQDDPEAVAPRFVVVTNWLTALRQRLGSEE